MIFREAILPDINEMMSLRLSVKENRLSSAGLMTFADYSDYLFHRGKGWVCETEFEIVGFAIVSIVDHNVWALFVHPGYDQRGIGRGLHARMLDWYFTHTNQDIWLSTMPGTRAEKFYRIAGWKEAGAYGQNEIKFVMTACQWIIITKNQ